MDKQQVIERLNNKLSETLKFQQIFEPLSEGHSGCESRANAYMTAINYVEQLDEPQKVKVPAYVEEHIEYSDSANWSLLESIQEMNGNVGSRELANWFEAHSEDYARAWLDGYEVEEEPLYYVKLPVVYFNHLDLETYLMKDDRGNITIADNNDFDDMKFTESEIKEIDERYWPFAVLVEEVAEG